MTWKNVYYFKYKGRLQYNMHSSFCFYFYFETGLIEYIVHYLTDKWGASGIFVVLCKWDLKICYLHMYFFFSSEMEEIKNLEQCSLALR